LSTGETPEKFSDPGLVEEFERMLDPNKGNAIVKWLIQSENRGKRNLNDVAKHGGWTQEDQECFAMLIGYSLSGAGDLSFLSQKRDSGSTALHL
jgi:hypothetical protein